MPNCVKSLKLGLLLLCLKTAPGIAGADAYAAQVQFGELHYADGGYTAHAHVDYRLSPTAKEALHKGVRLSWNVIIELRQPGRFWDTVVYRKNLPYSLEFHALLNQYAVQSPLDRNEMFLTLSAAMNFMATVRDSELIPSEYLAAGTPYQLAVKTQFNRESLPIPLRPVAYLDSDWFLSSTWYTWPIQK